MGRSPGTEIKQGQHLSPETEFKAGELPWNAGTKKFTIAQCEGCGRKFRRESKHVGSFRFCSLKCSYEQRNGAKHPGWKGGRSLMKSGYIRVSIGGGKYQYEHVLVAEKALGRALKNDEQVHHINGNKADNRNANLLVCNGGYHRSLERRMAYLYQQEHFA
jgi:hypothetical protein